MGIRAAPGRAGSWRGDRGSVSSTYADGTGQGKLTTMNMGSLLTPTLSGLYAALIQDSSVWGHHAIYRSGRVGSPSGSRTRAPANTSSPAGCGVGVGD